MKRIPWLDYLRAFACFLVAFCHLLKSLPEAGLMDNHWLMAGFVQIIYHFHVALFFFASGYLFQLSSARCADLKEYGRKKALRLVDLIIPYIIFSLVNYVIKLILAGSVNTPVSSSLWETLLLEPVAQMWYLYALAMVILVTPAIRSNKACMAIAAVSLGLKVLSFFSVFRVFIGTTYILQNQIWFVLGMLWAFRGVRMNWPATLLNAAVFAGLCAAEFVMGSLPSVLDALTTLTGVMMCAGFFQIVTEKRENLSPVWNILSRYMMQIYLLHTLFAAGVRIVLMKLGMDNLILHLVLGFIATFAGPVICAWIAERSKALNIVFFPSKTIRVLRTKK